MSQVNKSISQKPFSYFENTRYFENVYNLEILSKYALVLLTILTSISQKASLTHETKILISIFH